MKSDMETEEQTPVVRIRQETQRRGAQLPSLPLMGDPKIYIRYPDAMPPLARKNYVRDRMQSALTYILEYGQTEAMLKEGIYDEVEVQQRLCAVFRWVDAIRRRIDDALENDDMHRRRNMRVLPLPKNFPELQFMRQSQVPAWIRWIREESEKIVSDLEEEIKRRNNPDDPFDGTASGILEPLEQDTTTPLIPLPKEKKSTECKRKIKKSRDHRHQNNGTPVQNKETIESEQIEQARRQNEMSVILVNERVMRQEEEQLIDHPSISQSQQLEPNGMPVTNSRKSKKSHSSLDQGTHLQPFQTSTGYPEVHWYTQTYTIGERRRDQSNRRIPYEEPITRDPESTHEVQRKKRLFATIAPTEFIICKWHASRSTYK